MATKVSKKKLETVILPSLAGTGTSD